MAGLSPLADFRPEVRRSLRWLLVLRLVSNVGVRFPYSFLPALARGAGLSVAELGTVLAARDLSGLAAPVAGRAAQQYGTGRLLALGAVVTSLSFLVATAGATGLAVGLVVSGIGKIVYDVAMNTWVGDQIAYERRARATGLVELTWAAAAMLGIPLCGLLIDRIGWQAAPAMLGIAAVLPAAVIVSMSSSEAAHQASANLPLTITRSAVGALIGFCTLTLASQFLVVGHGLWLDDAYRLDPAEIGVAIISIGVIEAMATSASASFTDRLGKRRSVVGGTSLMALACLVFAIAPAPPLILALAVLATAFLGFEFGFVSALPLLAELDPRSRAKMIGLSLGLSTLMRAIGSPVGIWLFEQGGFGRLMAATVIAASTTVLVFALLVSEPTPSTTLAP